MDYMFALIKGFPNLQASCVGDSSVYENIVSETDVPIPTKGELDLAYIAAMRIEIWEKIKSERDRRKAGGVHVGSKWFHSDDASRIQQIGLVMFGANIPANLMWKTMDGSFVLMTQTLAMQIFQTTAYSDQAIFTIAEQHKQSIMQSNEPLTYNYLAGWPLTYGE